MTDPRPIDEWPRNGAGMLLPRRALVHDRKHGWVVADFRTAWNDFASVPGAYTLYPTHFVELPPLPPGGPGVRLRGTE